MIRVLGHGLPRRWCLAGAAALALALASGACAPKTPPPVAPGAPHYPDFVFPAVPDRLGDERLKARHETAWQYVQAGNLGVAGKEFGEIVKRAPAFYPSHTGLGYVRVAESRHKEALAIFDRVLARAPSYAPALVGKGEALAATGQIDLAIGTLDAARTADPRLVDVGRRIDVLRFGRVNELVASAAKAAKAGRLDEARQAYGRAIATSPDSAFLYRDLGLVELRAGAHEAASEHLVRATALDAGDAGAWAALATAYERLSRFDDAQAAWERTVELDPSEANRKALERVRDGVALARLPAEYRALPASEQINRGDLAALLGVRVLPLLPETRLRNGGVVVTDARTHWAATWILNVARTGVMEVYANHTFQPRASVRRVDLAVAVSRVLARLDPQAAKPPKRERIADLPGDHLNYAAVAAAVASGVLPLVDGGLFRPTRPVSGAEAVEAIGRLETVAKRARRGTRS